MTTITHTEIFFADEQQCHIWDDELLSIHPPLATTTTPWRTSPGWYWHMVSVDPDTDEEDSDEDGPYGPYATEEECRHDAWLSGAGWRGGEVVVSGSGRGVH